MLRVGGAFSLCPCAEQGVRTAGRCEKRAAAVSSEGSAGGSEAAEAAAEAAAEVVTARALAESREPASPPAAHASYRTQPPTASHPSLRQSLTPVARALQGPLREVV